MLVKKKEDIEEFFGHDHFSIRLPDGTEGDYNNALTDYYSKLDNLGECLDSNGSEAELINVSRELTVTVNFSIYDREYEKGYWTERNVQATGKVNFEDPDNPVYVIDKIENLSN